MQTRFRSRLSVDPIKGLLTRAARRAAAAIGFVLGLFLTVLAARASAPPILWSTNLHGQLFAVDAQTNTYVNQGGAVVVVNFAGVPLQTNAICPLPGAAQRDAAGNYYFAGIMTPPVNFGGVTLSTNACYLVKYTSSGTLVWATGFISPAAVTGVLDFKVGDLQVDPTGVSYVSVSWVYPPHGSSYYSNYVLRFDAGGVNSWQGSVVDSTYQGADYPLQVGPTKLGVATVTNCYAITFAGNGEPSRFPPLPSLWDFPNGAVTGLAQWYSGYPVPALHPVGDGAGNIYVMQNHMPTKLSGSGALIWQAEDVTDNGGAGGLEPVAGDQWGGFHAADGTGYIARFDSAGNMAWQLLLPAPCSSMIVDSSGNRFVSDTSGVLYALPPEEFTAPVITNSPVGVTVMGGSAVTLDVGAAGGTPFTYNWFFQNNAIPGANGTNLTLADTTAAQSGSYYVVVSNAAGSVTSAPAVLRVKNVELATSGQLLAGGTYDFATNPVITIESLYTNGSAFYTLDGSTPSFLSAPYTGPFTVSANATVNAIGYSADFSQSEFADSVNIVLPPKFALSAWTSGGGTVSLNPPGGSGAGSNNVIYLSNSVVAATATAAPGWTFLRWLGAATGTTPTVNLTLNQNQSLQAVFGTGLSTTVAGNGQVVVYPAVGLYAYGSVVRFQGIPGTGSYFGVWGNAGSGIANPLYFTVTNANPTVSSIFAILQSNQVSLTTEISGQGRVGVNPSGNVFATGQQVTITATPDAGQSFLGWNGGATGGQNPLTITLDQSTIITASFSGGSVARLAASSANQSAGGFTVTLISDPGSVYQIQVSTNLSTWRSLGTVTNTSGQTPFTDSGALGSQARFYRAQQ